MAVEVAQRTPGVVKRGYLRRKLHEARKEWTAYLFLSPGVAPFVLVMLFTEWLNGT